MRKLATLGVRRITGFRKEDTRFFLLASTAFVAGVLLIVGGTVGFRAITQPESLESQARQALHACSDSQRPTSWSKETCYAKEFETIAYEHGHDIAFDVLFELQTMDSAAQGCHFIAHGIGYGQYKRDPKNWSDAVGLLNPSCTYGAQMGMIERYVSSLPDGTLTREFIPSICGENPVADCNHIVGHLLLSDVTVQGDIDVALDLCSVFPDFEQRDFCLTGVFMEHITALNLIEHGYADESFLDWPSRVDELERLCRSHTGEEAQACWEEVVHAALVKFNNDPETIFDFCNSAPDVRSAQRCKRHSIGIVLAAHNFNMPKLEYMCRLPQPSTDPVFQEECYAYVVSSTLSTIPQAGPDSIAFCNQLDGQFQRTCFDVVGNFFRRNPTSYTSTQITGFCSAAPTQYRTICTGEDITGPTIPIRVND